jgi:hypothetical protein
MTRTPCGKPYYCVVMDMQFKCDDAHLCPKCIIDELKAQLAEAREAIELIAAPKRPDGTYNRSREACEQMARAWLTLRGEEEKKK